MSSATTYDSIEFIQTDVSSSPPLSENNGEYSLDKFSRADSLETDNISLSSEMAKPTQLAQWVYIQPSPKVTMSTPSLSKTNPTNLLLNSVSPLQMSNVNNNKHIPLTQPLPLPPNQNIILHPVKKPQQVYLQKPTMVPMTVSSNNISKSPFSSILTMIKTPPVTMSTSNHKYVLAPMSKFTNPHVPATLTTNCVQSKIALMPLSIQNTTNKIKSSKHNVYNLQIADGQIHTENKGAITVMCDNNIENGKTKVKYTFNKLLSNEMMNKLPCADEVECVEDKSYELSIVEDSNSTSDINLTINIPEEKDKIKPYRDPPKFQKHGVSILKKNYNLDSKNDKNSVIVSQLPNSITTISDVNTKEIKISTNPNFHSELPVIIPEPKVLPQKPERRRKSSFTCRKDYDYDEVAVSPPWNNNAPNKDIFDTFVNNSSSKNVTNAENDLHIIPKKEESDVNMNQDLNIDKILKWEDGIASLPGSKIRFCMNEFGYLEYIQNEEYTKILEKKQNKLKDKKSDLQEEMRCLGCGCYGLPSDFITSKHCSYDCQELCEKNEKRKEVGKLRRKRSFLKKCSESTAKEPKLEKEEVISEEDSTSNDCSQDKFNYPWTCTKKGFSWPKYLEHIKAKAVPVKFFKDPFPYNRNGFRPGMKLEGVDPQHPSHFCVLSVAEVIGYRMRLHFDGYSDNYDIWINADSMDIFPAGWCEKYGHTLHAPPDYGEDFNLTTYLKNTKAVVAPKHLFVNRAGSAICPNGFRVGMKLEAVDRKNTSLVCVASVGDMMDNRILVHFDSWDDIYDYWADPMSPYIHPVGWADQNGHSLTPPNDYPNPTTFTWEKYLKEVKATPVPVRAFKQRPVYGFKRGMRLECVDKRVPQLIRVATVDDTREHQIRVSFDGWPDRYSYWVDNDSADIHPVGWCQKTGHPIEPPLTPDDVYDFLECPTVGCRGQGHFGGAKYSTHSTTVDCPYSDENIDREHVLPDRLLTPDTQPEAVVPISREPKEKTKTRGRPPKFPRIEQPVKIECKNEEVEIETKSLRKRSKRVFKSSFEEKRVKKVFPLTNGYDNEYAEQIWEKHSRYLRKYVKKGVDPRNWEEEDVVHFISSLPYFLKYSNLFRQHKIDGEALLMLSQRDLVEILRIKLGPAIKLYCIIMLLRRNILN
ncbi:hypothetical protein FQA39_LY00928 [Lamprigera yunnana]|nr:hypothetical protein FQA39_LY00928 [Lamprigera yunnana]